MKSRGTTVAVLVALACVVTLVLPVHPSFTGTAQAQVAVPNLTSLSAATLDRSGRLLVSGSGFGASQGTGHLLVAGMPALVTTWTDTSITGYVPESAPLGGDSVRVVTDGGSSNILPLTVTSRAANGRVKWRFQMDAIYAVKRPAVGPDGTVYTMDTSNHLYALSPDGGLKWLVTVTSGGQDSGVAVGADGTIYAGGTQRVAAFNPDGTARWTYVIQPAGLFFIGPNVGPDGNIYGVADSGLGLFSLTPQGQLRWSVPDNPPTNTSVFGKEIVFGANGTAQQLYFHDRSSVAGFGLDGAQRFRSDDGSGSEDDPQPAIGPNGTLYSATFSALGGGLNLTAIDPGGNHLRSFYSGAQNDVSAPDIGPDGVIYDARNLSYLHAFNPDGSQRWVHTTTNVFNYVNVNPSNTLVLVGGSITFGQPCLFDGFSTGGQLQWQILLPAEDNGQVCANGRARFSADGNTAYVGTQIPGGSGNYSYLYAVDTSGGTPPPPTRDTVSVTQAQYTTNKHQLKVGATSTSTSATLRVFMISTNRRIGTLTNNGGGKYSGQFLWPSNPQSITVKSSQGGSASAQVTVR